MPTSYSIRSLRSLSHHGNIILSRYGHAFFTLESSMAKSKHGDGFIPIYQQFLASLQLVLCRVAAVKRLPVR